MGSSHEEASQGKSKTPPPHRPFDFTIECLPKEPDGQGGEKDIESKTLDIFAVEIHPSHRYSNKTSETA